MDKETINIFSRDIFLVYFLFWKYKNSLKNCYGNIFFHVINFVSLAKYVEVFSVSIFYILRK